MKKIKQFTHFISLFIILLSYLLNNAFNEVNIYNKIISSTLISFLLIVFWTFCISIFKSIKNDVFKNSILFIGSTVTFLLIIEIIFILIPRSHFFNNTLASKNWKLFYNDPINQFGYHDKEITKKRKKTLLFVGDSFTQGHGIKNIEDRFSNKIEKLNTNYSTINIGKNGLDTKNEFIEMKLFINNSKVKPDVIFLQYFGNDIEGIAYNKLTKENHDPYSNLPSIPKFLIKGSYLINYLYWLYPHEDYRPYLNYLTKSYTNKEIVIEHFNDLQKFIDYCNLENIKLNVIIFPFLTDPGISKIIYENKIELFFKNRHVETIRVSEIIKHLNKNERIVNSNDSHASIKVNDLIAKHLIKVLNNK
jgi:lysophospholipase L1-like esterase